MKKILLFLLVITMLASTIIFPVAQEQSIEEIDSNTENEKSICNATLQDEFEADSVLVSLTLESSKMPKSYTANDFKIDNIESIKEITDYSDKIWEYLYTYWEAEKISPEAAQQVEEQYHISRRPHLANASDFHRLFTLHLKSHTKRGVLRTIEELEELDFIHVAVPNHIGVIDESY